MKSRTRNYLLYTTLLLYLFSSPVLASTTLKGEMTFSRRAPEVALIYFIEDRSLSSKVQPTLNQKNKAFEPKLVVGRKGAKVAITNSDPLNHNVYAADKELKVNFDTGLASPKSVFYKEIDWEADTVVKVGCKIHPRMRAWGCLTC